MAIHRLNIIGSPNVGIFSLATDRFAVVPSGTAPGKIKQIQETVKVPVIAHDVGECKLIGALIAANSRAMVLPYYASESEADYLKRNTAVTVERFDCLRTALGNLILINDKGAIVDPFFTQPERKFLREIFDVEIVPGRLGSHRYVGSLGVATNRGAVIYPKVSEEEKKFAEEVLKVPVVVGTVNSGVPYVGSGLVANSFGILVGGSTTGSEMMIISTTLES